MILLNIVGSFIESLLDVLNVERIPQWLVTLLLSPCKVVRSVASAKPKAGVIESLS